MAYKDESDDHTLSNDQSHPSSEDGDGLFSGNSGQALLKKGPWSPVEDAILIDYVKRHGEGNWNAVQKYSGLSRCGKSCRLRWANHLRPNLKKGAFTAEEEQLIIELHAKLGNKWARMAAHLPGRTDNEIKNYWNTRVKRHHRAGLPLYPPNFYQQILNDNQLLQRSEKQHNHFIHPYSFGLDSCNTDQMKLSPESPFPNVPVSKMLNHFLGSSGYGNPVNLFKWFNETKALFPSHCGSSAYRLPTYGQYAERKVAEDYQSVYQCFPVDSDPGVKSLSAFGGTTPGSHALNGNFSTSQPISRPVKLELPSFQNSDTNFSGQIMHTLSPLKEDYGVDPFTKAESGQPEHGYPAYNGLLEALLYEAQVRGNAKNHKFVEMSGSSFAASHLIRGDRPNDYGTELGTYNLDLTDASIDCNTPCTRSSPLVESPSNIPLGLDGKLESVDQIANITEDEMMLPSLDFSRPDALLNSNWFIWDPIGSLCEECDEFNSQESGASEAANQSQVQSSCELKDMSPVC